MKFLLLILSCIFIAGCEKKDLRDILVEKADNEDAVAQYDLSLGYFAGKTFFRDLVKANYYLHKSAQNNNPQAQYLLGIYYLKGYPPIFPMDEINLGITYWDENPINYFSKKLSYPF